MTQLRRILGGLLAGVLIGGAIAPKTVVAQPGPYSQQIQTAIRALTTGAMAFNPIQAAIVAGGTGTTSTLTLIPTTGAGTTGADVVIAVGTNGGTEVGRFRSGNSSNNVATFTITGIDSAGSSWLFDVKSNGGISDRLVVGEDGTTTITGTTIAQNFQLSGGGTISRASNNQFNIINPIIKMGTSQVYLFDSTPPTISSGFGTSPSIASNNGPLSFSVNVGGGGAASSGVIGLPTATTGWNCDCSDVTTASSTVFLCKQTATATGTATIGNFNTAGAAAAWVANDILTVKCTAR